MFNLFKVKCEDCKHWVDRKDASEVAVEDFLIGTALSEWYCPMHKKKYTLSRRTWLSMIFRYYAELEVDKDGEPVGYVKKVNK